MTPTEIKLRRESKLLDIQFPATLEFSLPFEYLRVFSPSAEVRGHGGRSFDTMNWPLNKQKITITRIVPVGNYALQLHFDDGHNTGLYSWDYLLELGEKQAEYWAIYCARTGRDAP